MQKKLALKEEGFIAFAEQYLLNSGHQPIRGLSRELQLKAESWVRLITDSECFVKKEDMETGSTICLEMRKMHPIHPIPVVMSFVFEVMPYDDLLNVVKCTVMHIKEQTVKF